MNTKRILIVLAVVLFFVLLTLAFLYQVEPAPEQTPPVSPLRAQAVENASCIIDKYDLNHDCVIDDKDKEIYVACYNIIDTSGDGLLNIYDIALLARVYGTDNRQKVYLPVITK